MAAKIRNAMMVRLNSTSQVCSPYWSTIFFYEIENPCLQQLKKKLIRTFLQSYGAIEGVIHHRYVLTFSREKPNNYRRCTSRRSFRVRTWLTIEALTPTASSDVTEAPSGYNLGIEKLHKISEKDPKYVQFLEFMKISSLNDQFALHNVLGP